MVSKLEISLQQAVNDEKINSFEYELFNMTRDNDILHGASQRDLKKHSHNEKVL